MKKIILKNYYKVGEFKSVMNEFKALKIKQKDLATMFWYKYKTIETYNNFNNTKPIELPLSNLLKFKKEFNEMYKWYIEVDVSMNITDLAKQKEAKKDIKLPEIKASTTEIKPETTETKEADMNLADFNINITVGAETKSNKGYKVESNIWVFENIDKKEVINYLNINKGQINGKVKLFIDWELYAENDVNNVLVDLI